MACVDCGKDPAERTYVWGGRIYQLCESCYWGRLDEGYRRWIVEQASRLSPATTEVRHAGEVR